MRSMKISDAAIDRARATLCREFSRIVKTGALTVRARIIQADGKPMETCFYAHRNRRWEMQPARITDPALAAAILATLEMLASNGHHDAWSTKQRATAGYSDTDIRFHGEEFQHRSDNKLESELRSVLFSDRHDSKKDVRRSIHRRRRQ
ncbi:MAG: hypothetical protein ACT4QC_15345 [Planctomycetaceae bacterium]